MDSGYIWRMVLKRVVAMAGLILILPALAAPNLSTVNRDRLAHVWDAAENQQRPVTIVSFGDSMADSYRSPTYYLMNKFQDRLGVAGYSLNNYQNAALVNLTNGASFYTPPPELWYYPLLAVPPGAAVWWEKQYATGVYADQVGLFWVAQAAGGAMRLLVSTNGGPWATALSLSGYSASPTGGYTNLKLAPDFYRVRVETDSGTNYILGNQALLSQAKGLHAVFMDYPGIGLDGVTNVLPAVRDPFIAALKPDLLIWHMKEGDPLVMSNRMEVCETWWRGAAPDCDVLYIGTPWASVDTNSNYTIAQNTVVRNVALRNQRAYVDLMQPMVSYPWMVSMGYSFDGTHLSNAGGMVCAEIMWNDLGFFALGLNKRLALNRAGSTVNLSYAASAGAVYRLETSTNLQTWTGVRTNVGDNSVVSTNFVPAAGTAHFRLRLTPP